MEARTVCRICSGPLELFLRGGRPELQPNGFAPTCHRPGAHGDLYRCRACGTVQQPSLPGGAALHELYRRMRDAEYLSEEAGRRRTARRLLDLLGPPGPGARLLDVGCGPGLLLDEARRRGWDVLGLDLSRAAAAYARERLGLTVHETALEDADLGELRFDAIVIVDVFEHLEDPVGALERCTALLAPGGALMIVTPDPSSPTARLARGRWWGYLPAHHCLVPRATLRGLIAGRGLVLAEDVPYVRSFTPAYWFEGLGERGGPVGAGLRRLARRLPRRALLSLSLGDERVFLARRPGMPAPDGRLPAEPGGEAEAGRAAAGLDQQ